MKPTLIELENADLRNSLYQWRVASVSLALAVIVLAFLLGVANHEIKRLERQTTEGATACATVKPPKIAVQGCVLCLTLAGTGCAISQPRSCSPPIARASSAASAPSTAA